jgi:hypothetical protein
VCPGFQYYWVASRKPASLAVARNCGMGSSSLNAEVKALERLHTVRRLRLSVDSSLYAGDGLFVSLQ